MSTQDLAIQTVDENEKHAQYIEQKKEMIRQICAKDVPDLNFNIFIETAKRQGLDPIKKEIYLIKRSCWSREQNRNIDVWSAQAGIDGFRARGERTGEYRGQAPYQWCGQDGVWRDVWLEDAPPVAAKATIYKKNCEPFVSVALWKEYYGDKAANLQKKMPSHMLAKCAESLAWRKAFPNIFSGIYTSEEMTNNLEENTRDYKTENTQDIIDAVTDEPVVIESANENKGVFQFAIESANENKGVFTCIGKIDQVIPSKTVKGLYFYKINGLLFGTEDHNSVQKLSQGVGSGDVFIIEYIHDEINGNKYNKIKAFDRTKDIIEATR